jgi:excisionase family DNA binding protein
MSDTSTTTCPAPNKTSAGYAATSPFRLIGVGEVANLLGCSTRHVYRQVDGGKMPTPVKIGGINRWPVKTIEDWIAAGCPAVRKIGRG